MTSTKYLFKMSALKASTLAISSAGFAAEYNWNFTISHKFYKAGKVMQSPRKITIDTNIHLNSWNIMTGPSTGTEASANAITESCNNDVKSDMSSS